MNANVDDRPFVLLLDFQKRTVYSMLRSALSRAEATRRQTRQSYSNAYILDDSGLRRIGTITHIRLYGDSIWSKLFSALNSSWIVSTELSEPIEIDFNKLRALVIECFDNSIEWEADNNAEKAAGIKQAIENTANIAEVLDLFALKDFGDFLDVL